MGVRLLLSSFSFLYHVFIYISERRQTKFGDQMSSSWGGRRVVSR